ncbi:MAG: nucleoside deaminase [Alphaproteobacteria bacterium]
MSDEEFMQMAVAEAEAAAARGEVPVGAVLVAPEGTVVARQGNRVIELHDPTSHAEMLCLRAGASVLKNERLIGTTLYVTLEPCTMCVGAISFARVARLVFAAADPKGGAVDHGPRFFSQPTCHHRPEIVRMGNFEKAGTILSNFFRTRR